MASHLRHREALALEHIRTGVGSRPIGLLPPPQHCLAMMIELHLTSSCIQHQLLLRHHRRRLRVNQHT